MACPVGGYPRYIETSGTTFLSDVRNALPTEAHITACEIKFSYHNIVGFRTELFNHTNRKSFLDVMPADDFNLFKMMREECSGVPEETKKREDFAIMFALCDMPFESEPVQIFLAAFRKSYEDEQADPFRFIVKIVKKAHQDALSQNHNPVTILSNEITILYTLPEEPSVQQSLTLEKDYSQRCAHCEKTRSTAHKLSACSRCLTTFYCNSDCQRSNWSAHKKVCVQNKPG